MTLLSFHFLSQIRVHTTKASRQRGGICIDEYQTVFLDLHNTDIAKTVRSDHEKQMLKHDNSGCYFVPFETGVSKLEYCKSELSEHGYCVVDIEAIGIEITTLAITDEHYQTAVHKKMEEKLNEKVFTNSNLNTVRFPKYGFKMLREFYMDSEVHYDPNDLGDIVVWIPLYARKRLMAWSKQDVPPIVSASKQAVIFYSKECKHAGFTYSGDTDSDEFLLNTSQWAQSSPPRAPPRAIRLGFDFADPDKP